MVIICRLTSCLVVSPCHDPLLKRRVVTSREFLLAKLAAAVLLLIGLSSCVRGQIFALSHARDESLRLASAVKEFLKTLDLESTEALSQAAPAGKEPSMLWFWFQKAGTIAVRSPMDIKMGIRFGAPKERIPLEQVYRVDGYSVYYRQGNEFADARAGATPSFTAEAKWRQVQVIIHEDLHADSNFALPWEIEEAVATPLGALLTAEFFRRQNDAQNAARALEAIEEERKVARELTRFAAEAETIFSTTELSQAREQVLVIMARYPNYERRYHQQIKGQHALSALEAKVSHDLAYLRYFNVLTSLPSRRWGVKTLIADLKTFSGDVTLEMMERFLENLTSQYSAVANSSGQ